MNYKCWVKLKNYRRVSGCEMTLWNTNYELSVATEDACSENAGNKKTTR